MQVGIKGKRGSGTGQLDDPRGVELDSASRRLYVADAGNNRVQVYDMDGALLDSLTTPDPASPWTPVAVEVDGKGRVFVTDAATRQVAVLAPTGTGYEVRPLAARSL